MTDCKNCTLELNENDHFCKNCGAQIIKSRITLKSLFSNFLDALGWDSNFFVTIRHLLYKPHTVFNAYLSGTRKKYANPFSLLAIITALSLFVFSQFSEEFIHMSTGESLQQTEIAANTALDITQDDKTANMLGFKNGNEFTQAMIKFQMKYYTILSFLFLPIYTLMAFIVFRKPYNFGEHLLINTYIQSTTTLLTVLLFISSLILGINMFGSGLLILPFLYYSFAYKKLYKLTFGRLLLKIFKFLGLFFLLILIPVIIGFVFAVIKK